jgi:hypothetical protein
MQNAWSLSMNENLESILKADDKHKDEARGVLARMFRQILGETNTRPGEWTGLMNRYLSDPNNRIPANGKDRSSTRGNLNKELSRKSMTWKVFRKALRFIGATHVTLQLTLDWVKRPSTVHIMHIPMDVQLEDENDDDDTDYVAGPAPVQQSLFPLEPELTPEQREAKRRELAASVVDFSEALAQLDNDPLSREPLLQHKKDDDESTL